MCGDRHLQYEQHAAKSLGTKPRFKPKAKSEKPDMASQIISENTRD